MNKEMKTIIIQGKKNYLKKIAVIAIMIALIYILVTWLKNPTNIQYFLLPTEWSVIIFSLTGIIISILVIYLFSRNFFIKNPLLKIDVEGIYFSFFVFRKKTIEWKEIDKIESIKYNHNNYIAIFLKESQNDEKGINALFYNMNKMTIGTPYVIYSGDLDCTFSELERLILESYNQSKQN
ncbi:hypothetical protein HMPREF2660_05995 [Weeksella sp. HMSC059D05]|nr:hypothetical protein HMPREF2660_05995 [Weeksella sp. HMSC059D05]